MKKLSPIKVQFFLWNLSVEYLAKPFIVFRRRPEGGAHMSPLRTLLKITVPDFCSFNLLVRYRHLCLITIKLFKLVK